MALRNARDGSGLLGENGAMLGVLPQLDGEVGHTAPTEGGEGRVARKPPVPF